METRTKLKAGKPIYIPVLVNFKRQILISCRLLLESIRKKIKRRKKSYILLSDCLFQISIGLGNSIKQVHSIHKLVWDNRSNIYYSKKK